MSDTACVLTIAVPSYNVERYLAHGLGTLCDARLRDRVDAIVVDDGSSDSTAEIAKDFAKREPRIFRLLRKENGGHGSTINTALAAARGRYFRVVDADDWVTTDELASLLDLLEGVSDDVVVDVKREVDMTTREGRLFPLPAGIPTGVSLAFEEVCLRDGLVDSLMIHTMSVRTSLLRGIGLHLLEHTFYEDFEYVVKATLDARSLRLEDLAVYNYLVGNASQSVADASYVRRFDDHTRVTKEVLALYERRKGELDEARRAYLLRRAVLICNTHYNIALVFDGDRGRGLERAREFRVWLSREHPEVAALTERRYRVARLLHACGVSSQRTLDRLQLRRGR